MAAHTAPSVSNAAHDTAALAQFVSTDPQASALIRSGGSGTFKWNGVDVKVENGQVSYRTGPSTWKLLAFAGLGAAIPFGIAAATGGLTAGSASVAPSAFQGLPGAITLPGAGGASAAHLTGDVLRYGVPVAGNVIGGLIQAHAAGQASDAQQKYLEEALAYEKQRDAAAIALEGSRYKDYTGNIAPYLATGASANARMAGLLGLPESSVLSPPPSTAGSPAIAPRSLAGSPEVPRPLTTSTPSPSPTMVTMRAPDGSTKAVPQEQVEHFRQLGAMVVQ